MCGVMNGGLDCNSMVLFCDHDSMGLFSDMCGLEDFSEDAIMRNVILQRLCRHRASIVQVTQEI